MARQPAIGTRLLLTFFMAIVVLIGANMLITAVTELLESREAMGWPTAPGIVTRSEMNVVTTQIRNKSPSGIRRQSNEEHYVAAIEYEFEVNGMSHKGNRITAVQGGNLADRAHVKQTVDKYPAGKSVTVFYQPSDPSQCLLEPGTWGGFLVMAGLPLFLLVVAIAVTALAWNRNAGKYISGL